MKFVIWKAWHGEENWSFEMRKLVFSQDQESLRSGKLASDPKLGSEDFPYLIRSDNQCNQSQVALSANKIGSDLRKPNQHLKDKTDYH